MDSVTDTLAEIATGTVRGSAAGETLHGLIERHVAIFEPVHA